MRFDNFNTARCNVCGVIKQYQPGVNYPSSAFKCDCDLKAEEVVKKPRPKRKTKPASVKENTDGNSGTTT